MVIGVDKPSGMTSHDVVNRCRRLFGERRVGHTGTLDPLASGVLPICIGPATRLDSYMTGHDKKYVVDVVFGVGTDTDDAQGEIIDRAEAPASMLDAAFARNAVANLIGVQMQIPPRYSAVKIGGERAYQAARKGRALAIEPRRVEVYDASLLGVFQEGDTFVWRVAFHVSKGTYIRSLARDLGASLGCPAHVGSLRRTQVGSLNLGSCFSLQELETVKERAALDPVKLLGYPFACLDGLLAGSVACGRRIPSCDLDGLLQSPGMLNDADEGSSPVGIVSLVRENRLLALYSLDGAHGCYKPECVFQTGVIRGGNLR